MASEASVRQVRFVLAAAAGSEVFVAGTFNDWAPARDKLEEEPNGTFSITLPLPIGSYEYKFVVNGEWRCDPNCPDWVPNGFGTLNSVFHVS